MENSTKFQTLLDQIKKVVNEIDYRSDCDTITSDLIKIINQYEPEFDPIPTNEDMDETDDDPEEEDTHK